MTKYFYITTCLLFFMYLWDSCQTKKSEVPDPVIVEVSPDDNPAIGREDAPVTLIAFSDFECSYCQSFYELVEEIREDYIESGKVRYVYRDYPLENHEHAWSSAICANCAGEQGKYWEMYRVLFENQRDLDEENYIKWAKDIGLDIDVFNRCLSSPEVRQEIENDFAKGNEIGVKGTPTFIINDEMYGGVPPENVFRQLLDAAIEKSIN